MINFRYHIVSLMAVFLALSVGIVLGVSLRGPVDEGLAQQAAQDRSQVTELRAELDRRDGLDDYRNAWAQAGGKELTSGMLADRRVALIVMPQAPAGVVNALETAVTDAGGTVTHTVRINADVFDPSKAASLAKALARYNTQLEVNDTMSNGTRFGLALGRAVFAKSPMEEDALASDLTESLTAGGLVTVGGRSTEQAELALVVTAEASQPQTVQEVLNDHVEMDVALKQNAVGVVVTGPNSESIEATDVLTARTESSAVNTLSTVDVVDLGSGPATAVMAGKEQLLGGQGHYGALNRADAPLPRLPVR